MNYVVIELSSRLYIGLPRLRKPVILCFRTEPPRGVGGGGVQILGIFEDFGVVLTALRSNGIRYEESCVYQSQVRLRLPIGFRCSKTIEELKIFACGALYHVT